MDAQNDLSGATPLQMGASRGRLEVCKLLLARGADPTMRDDGGRCAADLADSGAPPELKKLLLEAPAPAAHASGGGVPAVAAGAEDDGSLSLDEELDMLEMMRQEGNAAYKVLLAQSRSLAVYLLRATAAPRGVVSGAGHRSPTQLLFSSWGLRRWGASALIRPATSLAR